MSDPVSKAINSTFSSLCYLTGTAEQDAYNRALENMRLAKSSVSTVFEDIAVDCEEGLPESKLFTVKLIFPFAGKPYLRDEVVQFGTCWVSVE